MQEASDSEDLDAFGKPLVPGGLSAQAFVSPVLHEMDAAPVGQSDVADDASYGSDQPLIIDVDEAQADSSITLRAELGGHYRQHVFTDADLNEDLEAMVDR